MAKLNLKWLYCFALVLSMMFTVQQGLDFQHSLQSVQIVKNELQSTHMQNQKYTSQAKTLDRVQTEDIRDTRDLQKIGNTFLNEMFILLPNLNNVTPKSSVATDQVASAFLGATFGGDVDEGTPSFHLESNNIVYSKSADGTGFGFGTVNYQQDQKETSITLLMHIEDGKITELQTGTVKDTSKGN